jgi:hypothetical protein
VPAAELGQCITRNVYCGSNHCHTVMRIAH